MSKKLSDNAEKTIDEMVERIAYKVDSSRQSEVTKEVTKEAFQKNLTSDKKNTHDKKKNVKSSNNAEFVEEIKMYLKDGLLDLMEEGYSEDEAIKITLDKFDETELNENFDDYLKSWEVFGMSEKDIEKYAKEYESVGLFYGGFTMLGAIIGACIGFFTGGFLDCVIGCIIGLMVGISLALFMHGSIVSKFDKDQTIGVVYGGFFILGLTIGFAIGVFAVGGIIGVLVCSLVGSIVGVACALLAHGIITAKK